MHKDEEDVESLLSRAKEQEKKFDWLGAAKRNLAVLELLSSDDATKAAEVQEAIAYDFYRAAFQSEDVGQFREGLEKASKHYEKAMDCYSRLNGQDAAALANRCRAMSALSGFWAADESSQKKSQLEKAWDLAKESFKGFHSSGNSVQYGITYNLLAIVPGYLEAYGDELQYRENIVREALKCGERIIGPLKEMQQNAVLAGVYTRVSYFLVAWIEDYVDPAEENKYVNRASEYFSTACDLSEETALAHYSAIGLGRVYPEPISPEETYILCGKGLDYVESTNDNYLIGKVLEALAAVIYLFQLSAIESPEDRESVAGRALENLKESQRRFAAIDFISPCAVGVSSAEPHVSHYSRLAQEESDLGRRKNFALRASERMPEYLRLARKSGFPDNMMCADYLQGCMLTEVSRTEDDLGTKKELLRRAIGHLGNLIDGDKRLHPRNYWFRGVDLGRLARAECDFAGMIEEPAKRKVMLKKALQDRIEGIELMLKVAGRPASQDQFVCSRMGESYYDLGSWCHKVFLQTNEEEYLRHATEAMDSSVKWYGKCDTPSRVAEACWRLAKLYDGRNEYLKAAESYLLAADQYKSASDKLPSLKEFYADHCTYLQAWSQIEKARLHHAKQEFAHARDCFEKASQLHGATTRWTYLASNYSAWANTERAEELSWRQEHSEAIKSFQEAAREFQMSQKEIESKIFKIDDDEGRQLFKRIASVSTIRQDYCNARIVLEEARLLDENSEDSAAADKFGQAAEMFDRIGSSLDSDEEKREFKLISTTAKAWQAMARAEAEASPGLYAEAARLFEAGKELCSGEKATAILLGHSRFCVALEAGMKFADTGESSLHSTASKNLESAAKFYLKADLPGPSEYAKASKLLFDGYEYMNEANAERESEKKARLFKTAEKVFEASAAAYSKAGHLGKRKQIEKLLEKVRDERQLAISLTEILHAPDVISTTMAFSSPTPTQETAVGLDRFAHADIQANLIAPKKELKVDEELSIEIELVNAGRGPAQLIKLQDPVPKGFTLREEPGGYRMEDGYLNLRGKRLDPLKTEKIKLVLKPVHRGQFTLKPRILYLDESGKYKSHEPEPMRVTVGTEPTVLAYKAVPADTQEAVEARSLLAGLNVVTLSHYRIVGNYVRYGEGVRNTLKDARQKIVAACQCSSPKRENYIIWAPPGSGKTYFVQEVAALLGNSVHYRELNLAKLDEAGFRSGLAELRVAQGPCLCLVDEVDANPGVSWPYEALMPFLDASATEGARLAFVLAGSSGSSLEEMKKAIASRPKGSDMLSRVPNDNEYSIPSMGVGDRMLVVLSQFRQAGKQMGHEVREVEKLGLYYVALNPRLSNARQLREFAVRCAERVLPGDDRLKYDSLFHPGDLENKIFWTQALQSAGSLVGSFLLVED